MNHAKQNTKQPKTINQTNSYIYQLEKTRFKRNHGFKFKIFKSYHEILMPRNGIDTRKVQNFGLIITLPHNLAQNVHNKKEK